MNYHAVFSQIWNAGLGHLIALSGTCKSISYIQSMGQGMLEYLTYLTWLLIFSEQLKSKFSVADCQAHPGETKQIISFDVSMQNT